MVETHFRPEERGPDEPDPDDPGLFIPDTSEGLPVLDRRGRRVGSITEGYMYGGSVERVAMRVDEDARQPRNLPEVVDLEAEWLNRHREHLQLIMPWEKVLDELGFD